MRGTCSRACPPFPGPARGWKAEPGAQPPCPCAPGPGVWGQPHPSTSDVGEEGRVASGGPPGLETSESLSDSLYDSLSSCGSQG